MSGGGGGWGCIAGPPQKDRLKFPKKPTYLWGHKMCSPKHPRWTAAVLLEQRESCRLEQNQPLGDVRWFIDSRFRLGFRFNIVREFLTAKRGVLYEAISQVIKLKPSLDIVSI